MSEELSAEEIRVRERRSFDAFNEAQAARRQTNRDARSLRDVEEDKRWVRPGAGAADAGEVGENDSPGG